MPEASVPASGEPTLASVQAELAASLYTEDAVHRRAGARGADLVGRDAIRKAYGWQERARRRGKLRLRSRHHVCNLVVRPLTGGSTATPSEGGTLARAEDRFARLARLEEQLQLAGGGGGEQDKEQLDELLRGYLAQPSPPA